MLVEVWYSVLDGRRVGYSELVEIWYSMLDGRRVGYSC